MALAGGRRAVGEDVALVAPAAGAVTLDADHAVAAVDLGRDAALLDGAREGGPTRARVELVAGVVERVAAAGAGVGAFPVLVPEVPGEGALGAFLAEDLELLLGEEGAPLGLAELEAVGDGRRVVEVDGGELRSRGRGALPFPAAVRS